MSEVTTKDIKQLKDDLTEKIEQQGAELRKEIKEQGVQLRKEIKEQGIELRQEIKQSAESVLEVVNAMAITSSNQFVQIDQKLEDLRADIMIIKREINNINSDIDRAYKSKTITEEETTALIAGQRRLEGWIEQIAKETGVQLTT